MRDSLFAWELWRATRASALHAARWCYGSWLLLLMALVFEPSLVDRNPPIPFDPARRAGLLMVIVVIVHVIMLLAVTPPRVAETICTEKAKATLPMLLTTPQSSGEIVFAKLSARVGVLAVHGLPAYPVLALAAAELDWSFGHLCILIGGLHLILVAVASFSFLAGIWFGSIRQATVSVYLVLLLLVLGMAWIVGGTPASITDLLFLAAQRIAELPSWPIGCLAGSMAVLGALASLFLFLSIVVLKPVCLAQLSNAEGGRSSRSRRSVLPPPGDDPLRWKERHVDGFLPPSWSRYIPVRAQPWLVLAGTTATTIIILSSRHPEIGFAVQGVLALTVANLVVAVRCATTISTEWERGTWQPLVLSGLEAQAIVDGKLRGILEAGVPFLAAHAVPALIGSIIGGKWCVLATLAGLVFIWPTAWIVSTGGIERSACYHETVKSLVETTVILGYLLGTIIAGISLLALFIGSGMPFGSSLEPLAAAVGIVLIISLLTYRFFGGSLRKSACRWVHRYTGRVRPFIATPLEGTPGEPLGAAQSVGKARR